MQTVEGGVSVGAAADQLHAAVAELVDPVKVMVQGVMRYAPSPYAQLQDEVAASSGKEKMLRGVPSSRPPARLDALDLLTEIDGGVAAWQPEGVGTVDRLRRLAARRWRPQDAKRVVQAAEGVKAWTVAVHGLLEPKRVKTISAPCPKCGESTIYRRMDGETVKQPALQLVLGVGCQCQRCRASWPPEQFLFLVRLLGFDLPAGVVG